jgi:hypothetical protein
MCPLCMNDDKFILQNFMNTFSYELHNKCHTYDICLPITSLHLWHMSANYIATYITAAYGLLAVLMLMACEKCVHWAEGPVKWGLRTDSGGEGRGETKATTARADCTVATLILNLVTGRRWVITFTTRPLYLQGKTHQQAVWAAESVWTFRRR